MTYNVTSIEGDDDDATITVKQVHISHVALLASRLIDGGIDYEAGLQAAYDDSHGWIDKGADTLRSFKVGVDAALAGAELYEIDHKAAFESMAGPDVNDLIGLGVLVRVGKGDNE